MNENIFDVLMYIFENYMIEDISTNPMRADIEDELFRLGFSNTEVVNAFGWLEGLLEQCTHRQDNKEVYFDENLASPTSMRYYLAQEKRVISVEIQGLLHTLEQNNIINHEVREIMIDRMMAFSSDSGLSDDKAKWIMMMVLINCHTSAEALEQNDENKVQSVQDGQHTQHFLDWAESLVFKEIYKH